MAVFLATRAVAVQCTLCGARRVLTNEWAEAYNEFRAQRQRIPCFATEACHGEFVHWQP